MKIIRGLFLNFLAILNLMRYWQWQDKIQTMTIAVLLLVLLTNNFQSQFYNIIFFIIYLYFPLTFGYLINSLGDKDLDARVGKDYLKGIPSSMIYFIVILSFLGSAFFPLVFKRISIMILTYLGVILTGAYSLKPFRLKERGLIGLLSSSILQRLPFLFFLFLLPDYRGLCWYLFFWLFLVGILVETSHQLGDYFNDQKTQVKTFVCQLGYQRAIVFIYWLRAILLVYVFLPIIYCLWDFNPNFILLSLILFVFSNETLRFSMIQLGFSRQRGENAAKDSAKIYDGI